MNEEEKKFINSVSESEKSYAVKRFQIREWYKPFGRKILTSSDLSYISKELNNFSDEKYWTKREYGDPILNRASVLKELLSIKKVGGESLLNDYKSYKVKCWLCSEESIRGTFSSLGEYKGDSESEEEFITDTLSRYSRLMEFWSHYIHVVDEEGKYKAKPNKGVLDNLKELIAKYNKNYRKNLDCGSQVDLWKYGFECAKEEGCIEALEFFCNKLEETKESELAQILIDAALYATSSGSFSLRHSNANVIDFCLANLSVDNYEVLLQKDFGIHGCYSILDRLENGYLFGYVEKLIDCLEPESISRKEFENHLVCGMGSRVGAAPSRELMRIGADFLVWVWEAEGFKNLRGLCLDDLSRGRSGLIDTLLDLAMVGAFEPLEKILNSASKMGREKIAESFRNSSKACCALYIQGGKDLLIKVLGDTKYSSDFVRAIEEILKHNPSYKEKWNEASELHKEFRIRESMIKISELLSDDGLRDDIKNKINQFQQYDHAEPRARSKSLSDIVAPIREDRPGTRAYDDCALPSFSGERSPVQKRRSRAIGAYGRYVQSSLSGMSHLTKKDGTEITSKAAGNFVPSSLSDIQSTRSIEKEVSK
ncbi:MULTISPECIES: hypothetical protein [unclassified Wolbachia]|uniref:hypothetical protein n=1 Tax=unclassified Wolbachia TaxID=2640676 RepID=UPI001250A1B9|nr:MULTISPECIES: hypothetical protein [unclassified Wolbachia]KAB2977750.1 hypothetical protein DEF52_05475 [Wolbachia endosymbiont of Nasonia oneida]MDU8921085.1 hypothetical protein [Wolbachia endosymbiont of Scaptomyza pallida]